MISLLKTRDHTVALTARPTELGHGYSRPLESPSLPCFWGLFVVLPFRGKGHFSESFPCSSLLFTFPLPVSFSLFGSWFTSHLLGEVISDIILYRHLPLPTGHSLLLYFLYNIYYHRSNYFFNFLFL